MNLKKGPKGAILDIDGNLFFPEIDRKKLKINKERNSKVIKETKDFLKKNNFSPERIEELKQFKKNFEDMKNLEKIENKIKHVKFMESLQEEINAFDSSI